jgi:hypothetical protein
VNGQIHLNDAQFRHLPELCFFWNLQGLPFRSTPPSARHQSA